MEKAARGSHGNSILTGKDKYCYVTGRKTGLEKHHIFFGSGMREISDRNGFWVYLTTENHRGTYGVHGKYGHELDMELKRACQRRFEESRSRKEWMEIIRKNYLEAEE